MHPNRPWSIAAVLLALPLLTGPVTAEIDFRGGVVAVTDSARAAEPRVVLTGGDDFLVTWRETPDTVLGAWCSDHFFFCYDPFRAGPAGEVVEPADLPPESRDPPSGGRLVRRRSAADLEPLAERVAGGRILYLAHLPSERFLVVGERRSASGPPVLTSATYDLDGHRASGPFDLGVAAERPFGADTNAGGHTLLALSHRPFAPDAEGQAILLLAPDGSLASHRRAELDGVFRSVSLDDDGRFAIAYRRDGPGVHDRLGVKLGTVTGVPDVVRPLRPGTEVTLENLPTLCATRERTFLCISLPADEPWTGEETHLLTGRNASITVGRTNRGGIRMRAESDLSGRPWEAVFDPPVGERLAPGLYTGALALSYPPEHPRLEVRGACGASTGSFEVLFVSHDDTGVLERFAADFVIDCGSPPRHRAVGRVVFRADPEAVEAEAARRQRLRRFSAAPAAADGGGLPPPSSPGARTEMADLDTVCASDSPTFLCLKSHGGDPVGRGLELLFTPENAEITWSQDGLGWFRVRAAAPRPGESFGVRIAPPKGERVETGLHQNPRAPDLEGPERWNFEVYGGPVNCSHSAGEMRIYHVSYTPQGRVESFAADFEHSCRGSGVPMVGRVFLQVDRPPPSVRSPAPAGVPPAPADGTEGSGGPSR